jgi:hypothetical protein
MHPDDLASISEWGHADLGMETEAFQAYVEGVRANPDDAELAEDMSKAKAAMETAWLRQLPVQ